MLILLSFLNGLYHGLGSDHLMAITTVASRGGNRREMSLLGLRFGMGHMVTLLLLASLALVWDIAIPPIWESRAETFGGALLILLGLWTFTEWLKQVGYIHSHAHTHSDKTHDHLHFHLKGDHPHEHVHPHFSSVLGGLFAFSGLRALLLTAFPVVQAHSLYWALLYILVFGAGIVIAMTVYGLILGSTLGGIVRRGGFALCLSGASICFGIYWIWTAS